MERVTNVTNVESEAHRLRRELFPAGRAESEAHRLRRELFPAGRAEAGLSAVMRNAGDPMTDEAVDDLNRQWFDTFADADDIVGHLQALLGPAAVATFLIQWRNLRTAGERLTMNLDMQAHVARERNRSNQNAMRAWDDSRDEVARVQRTLDSIRVERDEWHEDWSIANAMVGEYERTIKGWRKVGIVSERMLSMLGKRTVARSKKAVDGVRAERNQAALELPID